MLLMMIQTPYLVKFMKVYLVLIMKIETLIEEIIVLYLIEIYQVKIGFVSGNKPNPFDNIYLYNSNEKDKFKINNNNLTFLISDVYQEYIFIVFYKNFDIIEKNKNLPVLKKQFKKYFNENFPSIDI